MTKRRILFIVLLLVAKISYSQLPLLQQDPQYINWYVIKTDHFKIISPQGMEEKSQQVANTLEAIYAPLASSIGVQPRRITVILRTQNAISNGFVSQQPRRSEFYLTPPQNYNLLGTNSWSNLLSIHEYRHVAQLYKANRGLNRLLYLLFGQQVIGGIVNIAVPDWFLEGDATLMETVYTKNGRGRLPGFFREFRANLLEYGAFSYNKQYLGSFNHFVPDHYRLGYQMVNYVRKSNDRQVWDRVLKRAYYLPIIPFSFSSAIMRETGKFVVPTYNDMMTELASEWKSEIDNLELTEAVRVNKRQGEIFTNYKYPQFSSSGSIVVLKSGLGDYSQLVEIGEDGKEKLIFVPGSINDSQLLSVSDDKICWVEFEPDLRWQTRIYSVIKVYDMKSKILKKISRKTKYMTAVLSQDGKRIATIEVSPEGKSHLVILDSSNGNLLRSITNEENRFLSMPRFAENGLSVVLISQSDDGRKTISSVELSSNSMKDLLPLSHENVSHPVPYKNYVLFNSPYSGIDNVHAFDINSKQRYMITSSKYGANNASISPDENEIFFNEYKKEGFDVVRMPFDTSIWKLLSGVEHKDDCNCQEVLEQEENTDVLSSIDSVQYESKRYHKAFGMINPYNWGGGITPSLNSLSITSVEAAIESRDVLSTSFISGGYSFDLSERTGFGFGRFSYQGWYPVVDVEISNGGRKISKIIEDDTVQYKWSERQLKAGIRVPFNFTRSKYFRRLQLASFAGLTEVRDFNQTDRTRDLLGNGVLRFFEHSITYSRLHKLSKRDIRSKLGQVFQMDYMHTPIGGDFRATYFSAQSRFLFPGLVKHHSFDMQVGYQHQSINDNANYLFRTNVSVPRGYNGLFAENFYSFSLNYSLPLAHPDFHIGPILNIQRIRINPFFDYAYRTDEGLSSDLSSFGVELKFDFNVLRFRTLLDGGLRYSYKPEFKKGVFEAVIANLVF